MATNDANQPKLGRQLSLQVVHTLRKNIAFDDPSLGGEVGILPAGAIILTGAVYVSEAFDAGTLDVGAATVGDDEYASALALNSAAVVAFDDLAIANQVVADDTVVTFERSADATAGAASIVITYAVDNG